MHFTITQAHLKSAITAAASVVERRNTVPILTHVKMTAANGKLHLLSTDLDISYAQSVDANIEIDGECAVNADILKNIVAKLPVAANLEFELKDGKMTVYAGRSRFELNTLSTEDFPIIATEEYASTFDLPASDLQRAISKTRFAVSNEETRYYLNGLYLHSIDDKLTIASTDGHRLARHTLPHSAPSDMPGVIIPNKTVGLLGKLLDGSDIALKVSVSETKIRFMAPGITIVSKVIDGTFPDYQRVIPGNLDKSVTIDSRDLRAAVDRVVILADDKARGICLSLTEDQIELNLPSSTQGSARDVVACAYSGDDLEIGFNSKLLLSAVQATTGADVTLQLGTSGQPALIDDNDTLMLIMPMRV